MIQAYSRVDNRVFELEVGELQFICLSALTWNGGIIKLSRVADSTVIETFVFTVGQTFTVDIDVPGSYQLVGEDWRSYGIALVQNETVVHNDTPPTNEVLVNLVAGKDYPIWLIDAWGDGWSGNVLAIRNTSTDEVQNISMGVSTYQLRSLSVASSGEYGVRIDNSDGSWTQETAWLLVLTQTKEEEAGENATELSEDVTTSQTNSTNAQNLVNQSNSFIAEATTLTNTWYHDEEELITARNTILTHFNTISSSVTTVQ